LTRRRGRRSLNLPRCCGCCSGRVCHRAHTIWIEIWITINMGKQGSPASGPGRALLKGVAVHWGLLVAVIPRARSGGVGHTLQQGAPVAIDGHGQRRCLCSTRCARASALPQRGGDQAHHQARRSASSARRGAGPARTCVFERDSAWFDARSSQPTASPTPTGSKTTHARV
jgi:hypothetical protein